ncbi:MAG: hypothetical protein M5U28_43965 [Sandaracinaceae bacterium]|nr:hypothetical protein [Sandaracinaceae bacterium]
MHWVDLWWHAVPALRPSGPDLSIADLGAVLVVSGACALLAMLRSRRARPLSARVRGYRSEWGLDGEPAARAVARRPARARSEAPPELRQSPEGLHARGIAVVVAVSTAVLALALAVALWMSAAREGTAHAPDVTPRGAIAAVERGAFEGPARGLLLRAEDEARLHRYGWADRRRGLAQVPIARALELAAAGCRPPGAGASAFRLEDAPSPCELGAAREAP